MMKSNTKKFIVLTILLSLILFIFTLINTKNIQSTYKKIIIENNATIINGILEKHPELKEEMISILLTEEKITNLELLSQYGINEEWLNLQKETNVLKKELKKNNYFLFLTCFITLFLCFFIYHNNQKRKIKEITSYMEHILNEDYTLDIRDYKEGDMSNLKNYIFKMTTKLKEQHDILEKDKKYLTDTLQDISHQLKTPLTSLYVINEVLETEDDPKIRHEFLQKNEIQLKRIEWLITSLLKVSRLDSGTVKMKKTKEKVKDLIDQASSTLQIPMELKKINYIVEGSNEVSLKVDKNWMIESLLNILKNACEHLKEEGTITIKIIENPIYTRIEIKDDGEGIQKNDLPHIFERFYKGSKSSKDSIGIGLNLSKKIIELNGGDITVESEEKKGTTFQITFYKSSI